MTALVYEAPRPATEIPAKASEVTRARARFLPLAGKCGAKTRSGNPCGAKGLPRTKRCKWHGGKSTGPRTPEGRGRALANLKQFRNLSAYNLYLEI
jgi:hypothetical protein